MAVTHGMDVGEIRRLGGSLQSTAESIDALIRDVDRTVSGSSWVGPDAVRFKSQWWPGHKAHLQKVSRDLHGLGQSALNNASEQEDASGAGPIGAGGGNPRGRADQHPGGGSPGSTMPSDGGGMAVPGGDHEGDFVKDWRSGGSGDVDRWGFYRSSTGNCTSYAAWRLNDLAKENGLDWSMTNTQIDGAATHLSNANNWDDAARDMGIPVDDNPVAGAVAQWNEPYANGYGHVAIVRSVDPVTGAITIEESSWGGAAFQVKTLNPGDAGYPDNFIHMLPGT